jgi:hypothetical protein
MTDLNYARGRAVSLNQKYRVKFDVNTDIYEIEKEDESTDPSTWILEKSLSHLAEDKIDVVSLTRNPVDANPTGTMTQTMIKLQNSKGQSLEITTSGVGGVEKGTITN